MNTISVRRVLGGLGWLSAIFALVALAPADEPAQLASQSVSGRNGNRLAVAGRGRFRQRELCTRNLELERRRSALHRSAGGRDAHAKDAD